MSEAIQVLDHGFVRLVESMGSDMAVVRAARVSYNEAPRNDGSDEKLIGYLMKNKHTSPFESVHFTFEVKAPIFILRQWHRHRTWKYNELSARYRELPEEFYVPIPNTIGKQSSKNKQARDQFDLTDQELKHAGILAEAIRKQCFLAFATYQGLLTNGCPRELARGVLPVNTYSHMFATVDLHNLFHFLRLRLDSHAQWEIQQYGKAILELIRPLVPICTEAFELTLGD